MKFRAVVCAFVACAALSACAPRVDTEAVAKLASAADSAGKISDAMAADLYDQCVTAREYATIASLGATGDVAGEKLDSLPIVGDIPPSPAPASDDGATSTPKPSESSRPQSSQIAPSSSCTAERILSREWRDYNRGIFAYAKGVAAVSGVSVSVDAKAYQSLGSDLAKVGAVRNDAIAKSAATFLSDLGDELLKDQKNRDVRSIVQLSQRDGIFRKILGAAESNGRAYYGLLTDDKSGVDDYYVTIIGLEQLRLLSLLRADGDTGAALRTKPSDPMLNAAARRALEKPCGNATECEKHVALVSQIAELRDRIASQRRRWRDVDLSLMTGIARVQPYYDLIVEMGAANDAIVQASPGGLRGVAAALLPHAKALAEDADALATAASATREPIK